MSDNRKLKEILNRFDEISANMLDNELINDRERYLDICKEHAKMTPIVECIKIYLQKQQELSDNLEMLSETNDSEFETLLKQDIAQLKNELPQLHEEIQILMLPQDPRDQKDIYLEIKGAAGGEEAALFAEVLFKMYQNFAASKGYDFEVIDLNETELGGIKDVTCSIKGEGAYSQFKYEIGVHRVQRVPVTESGGRIHTSTVTVAVLPEVEEVDVNILPGDINIDTYRASGAGGQHVNKTSSAIRITHLPTGIVVTCQDQRSQYKNKDRAMSILRSKLYDLAQSEREGNIAEARRDQVGTGDRSERIRTYNYPQGRVTDHRINLTLYKLDEILNGDLACIVDELMRDERSRLLAQGNYDSVE